MSDPPRSVLIGIPCLDWRVNAGLATFLFQLLARSSDPSFGWRCSLAVVPEVSPVEYARNLLVGIFLRETDADALWFIDDDMMPEPGAERVLEVDADVVAGHCLAAQRGDDGGMRLHVAAFTARSADGRFTAAPPSSGDAAVPIVAAGAANLLVRRRVLADPRMHADPTYVDLSGEARSVLEEPDFAPPVFRTRRKPNGQVLLSEDLDFVHRAHSLGYRCMLHPGARMGHLKRADLNGIARMLARDPA